MNKTRRYSPEVRERAVRMVFEHEAQHDSQWATIRSIAAKIGCSAETLRKWVRQAERDSGRRRGLATEERERLKELEQENCELRRVNEILRKSSAYFAQAELTDALRTFFLEGVCRPGGVVRDVRDPEVRVADMTTYRFGPRRPSGRRVRGLPEVPPQG